METMLSTPNELIALGLIGIVIAVAVLAVIAIYIIPYNIKENKNGTHKNKVVGHDQHSAGGCKHGNVSTGCCCNRHKGTDFPVKRAKHHSES